MCCNIFGIRSDFSWKYYRHDFRKFWHNLSFAHSEFSVYIYIYIYIYIKFTLCVGGSSVLGYRNFLTRLYGAGIPQSVYWSTDESCFGLQAGTKYVRLFQNNQNGSSSHPRPLLQWEAVAKWPSRKDRYLLHHTLASLKIRGAIPPHVHKNSWYIDGQLYLHLTQHILNYANAFNDVKN